MACMLVITVAPHDSMPRPICSHAGLVQESLQLFQQATSANPHNIANLKQVGRTCSGHH